MSTDTYIGIGLALLASNMCLLLLVLNVLGWINVLHMDLAPIEQFAESTLSQYQVQFQTATAGWLVFFLLTNTSRAKPKDESSEKKDQYRRPRSHTALIVVSVLTTLALPHLLEPHRHRHPIIRRSVLGNVVSASTEQPHAVAGEEEPTIIQQELVFTVDNMTCGGCGSHVRNLAESTLNKQRKSPPSFTVSKVEVDWKAGVMSVYGTHLTEHVDQQSIISVLKEDGYPTSFLYSQS